MNAKKNYDESSIKSLDALSHIRTRPGMYIGRLGDGSEPEDGIYILLKEVIDNSVDEFIMNHGQRIDLAFDEKTQKMSVRDYGRGIPLGKVIECVSQINTGAKYDNEVFQFSVGLNGVGLKAVNALSSHFYVESYRDRKVLKLLFEQGVLKWKKEEKSQEPSGTFVSFIPDSTIFKKYSFKKELIHKKLWTYAYLNQGLSLKYQEDTFYSENGLLDFLMHHIGKEPLYAPFHLKGPLWECAFVHTAHHGETYYSFTNGQYTIDGGTHLAAFKEGVVKGFHAYSAQQLQAVDIREGLIGCIAVKVNQPMFESQTKNKLSNPEIKAPLIQQIKESLAVALHRDPTRAKKWIDTATSNENLRLQIANIKKQSKENQKKISLKIPKLRDCKLHLTDSTAPSQETMIFLTEGESASASILAARDPMFQAIFSLRGKPLNVFGMKMDQLYKNEEMYHLMMALDIEEDISKLRYHKVILATDADVDGMHIRNLLITFFLSYFESLVIQGHLFILQTPLFKVRSAHNTYYCYSVEEKNEKVELEKNRVEVTRFKGLGEISPKEFKQFIGDQMRLVPVVVDSFSDIQTTLEFYMGKNTPTRKEFIMENLKYEEVTSYA